jgi:hypothetical protein
VENDQAEHPGVTPQIVVIHTTPQQDQAMQRVINQMQNDPGSYNLYGRNCAIFVERVLQAGGQNPPNTPYPRKLFNGLP